MSDMDISSADKLLEGVRADAYELLGGPETNGTGGSGSGAGGPLGELLGELSQLLQQIVELLGNQNGEGGGGSGGTGGSGSTGGPSAPAEGEVIAGSGRIWGDPHFIGQDGGKYDVQGEAGKSYNLLSDQNFQMNGRFDEYNNTDGLTVVGQVGIAAGADQIEVNKNGDVFVNGEELKAGDKVELEDGGFVEYNANGGGVTIESGEWTTEIEFRNKGDGPKAHLNIDVHTENAVADGVKPHGLLGQTFDSDDDARNGDKGKGTQGGGAIEDANGNITERGDTDAIGLYEVDNVHDRNFTEFNQFFDEYEADPEGFPDEIWNILSNAFAILSDIMSQMGDTQNS